MWQVRLGQDRLKIYKKISREYHILCVAALAPYGRLGWARIGQKYKEHIQGIPDIMCGSASSIWQVRLGQDRLEI